jgi:hypothetical protein
MSSTNGLPRNGLLLPAELALFRDAGGLPAEVTKAQVSCYIQHMARGHSGRLVLEVDPALKRALYSRLAAEGLTLKDWFLARADQFLKSAEQQQLALPGLESRRRGKRAV